MSSSENPYEPPAGDLPMLGPRQTRRETLRKVALYQKGIVACILVYVTVLLSQAVIPERMTHLLIGVALCDIVVGTTFVFLLSARVYTSAVGVWMGLLTLVPCLGLGILAITDRRATVILRQNGVKVGLFGANLREI